MRLSAGTAAENAIAADDLVSVSTDRGTITLPAEIVDMPERVVWVPLNSPGSAVYAELGPAVGHIVRVQRVGAGVLP
jgi:NADH-quinone oxidoreductase subunit G